MESQGSGATAPAVTGTRRFGAQSMTAPLVEVLVKRPGPAFGAAFDDPAHGFLHPVDLARAQREHDAFVDQRGPGQEVGVRLVPEHPACVVDREAEEKAHEDDEQDTRPALGGSRRETTLGALCGRVAGAQVERGAGGGHPTRTSPRGTPGGTA